MIMIYYAIGVAILIAGLVRGAAWPRTRAATQIAGVGLFWASVAGLLGVLALAVSIVGIAIVFDERTDAVNGFDQLFIAARYLVLACTAIAVAGHAFVMNGTKQDAEHHPGA